MLTKLTAKNDGREWRDVFLETLALSGNITLSCQAAHISRQTAYETRKDDEAFCKAWDDALAHAADLLENEAVHRAANGTIRYKFDKNGDPLRHPETGEPYVEYEYSDTLLIFLLKGAKPEKFRERHEVSGPDGGSIPVSVETAIAKVYADPEKDNSEGDFQDFTEFVEDQTIDDSARP